MEYSSSKFSIGDTVNHQEFGMGKVLGIFEKTLKIRFENNPEIIDVFSDFVEKN